MMDNNISNVTAVRASGPVGSVVQCLNIAQWNSQSLMPKKPEFELLLSQEKIGICLLSETWLDQDTNLRISNYNVFRKDRTDSYGGVAIVVHKSIKAQRCSIDISNSGIETLCVKILNCKYLEHVVSVYCPSTVRTSQCDWDHIFSKFSSKSIVAGDFNAHHSNWSCKIDTRGLQLLDSSLEHNFVSLNSGEFTRVKLVNGHLQESAPDITFVTSELAVYFKWQVTRENFGSDHLLIKYSLQYHGSRRFIRHRNFKLANWQLYQAILKDSISDIICEGDIQTSYDLFIKIVNDAARISIPMIKNCTDPLQTFQPKPYWCPAISSAIAQRRLALKVFRRNPTPDNLDKLNEKIAEAQRVHRRARSANWQQFCGMVDETMTPSDMWRRMRWMKGIRRDHVSAPSDKKEELLRSLAPDFVQTSQPVFTSNNTSLDREFTLKEFQNGLKKKDTAPGEDSITYSMIYNLPLEGKLYLLQLFNQIFKHSLVPEQWRSIQIVPIPKPNPDPNLMPKFRPISLISCVCKIFHLMLCKRIEWFVEKHKILAPVTSGFRKCQSCIDCLVRLVTQIQLGFSKDVSTLAVFLDVESAYNNVLTDQLVMMLDNLNMGSLTCKYLWTFLSNRFLKIKDDDGCQTMVRWTGRGLAQGDPLSPLLFNIATHQICTGYDNVNILQYADDFVFYTQNRSLELNEAYIQRALDSVVGKLRELGLEISPTKTQCCSFRRGRKVDQVTLYINNNNVTCVTNVKYLGIWLDKSLLWSKHINETCEKTMKMIGLLKVLAGASWGVHPKHLRRLYIALIRSRIDYGCFLYETATKTHLLKLDRIQNIAMRVIGGFIRTTPIHAMECEVCLHPLQFRRQYLATKYCLKAQSFSDNITIALFQELLDRYWQKKPLLISIYEETKLEIIKSSKPLNMFSLNTWVSDINLDFIETTVDGIDQAKSQYDNNVLKSLTLFMINDKYKDWHKLYTDGSKIGDSAGAAYYDPSRNVKESFKVTSEHNTIMSVELFAISESLSYAATLDLSKLVIMTDSRSALQHIAHCVSGASGASVAYGIIRKVLSLRNKGVDLRLQWVPSHVGLQGNEEADKLAKEAFSVGAETFIVPEHSEVLFKYKYKVFEKWKMHYLSTSESKGIWYRIVQCEPPRIPWFVNTRFKRCLIVTAHRLRTGHIPLAKFNHLMKISDSPNCATCGVTEDVHHLLVECVRSQFLRTHMCNQYGLNLLDVGAFQCVLSAPLCEAAKALFSIVYNIISS